VFSAIRVGGDDARIVDERVALKRGLVGQETTGPGGCAMALRTIPVVLAYCEVIARLAPGAVLVNFTNPAGIITQAITTSSPVRVVGVCDTPSGTISRLADFLEVDAGKIAFSYAGLNHLGWITSVVVDGEERIDRLVTRYDELRTFNYRFAAFDAALVRRLGCIPTDYLYYYYDPGAYVARVASAGTTRGESVRTFNERLITSIVRAFDDGDVHDAWRAYSQVMAGRRASYMRLDVEGVLAPDTTATTPGSELTAVGGSVGGYEGVALRVIDGLSGAVPERVVVNTVNGGALEFVDPDDVVEVPAVVDPRGVAPLANAGLAGATRGLVLQVKEYERTVVEAALTGDAGLAAVALALHPLVPGMSAARALLRTYRELHGPLLEYLK
jgi:6-phospho-beta-glucosidase